MSTDHVLASIDSTLADFDLSDDAMRWTPEPPRVICDSGRPLMPERYSPLRHGTYYYTVTPMADLPAGSTVTISFDAIPLGMYCEWVREALAPKPPAASSSPFAHELAVSTCRAFGVPLALVSGHTHPRRARCRPCNPAGNPPPLAASFRPGPKAARMRRRRR